MALATCTMALWAAGALPCATTCQVWKGVPIATVGAWACTVGTTQLTSPTSVEPTAGSRRASRGTRKSARGASVGVLPIAR